MENNTGLPRDENWLDDILGTDIPKAELSTEELANQADEPLDMDKLMEESWDTDQQTIENIQDSVAQELPEVPMQEQFTTRIPFFSPDVEVTRPVVRPTDEPTTAIPVLDATTQFVPVEAPTPSEVPEGTQRFELPQEPVYTEPAYTEPAPQYVEPAPQYTEPVPQYTVPEPQYTEPAPQPIEQPVQADAPAKSAKGRPAPKKGYGLFGIPHIISTVIWLMVIVVAGVSLGRMLWVCCADVMAFGKPNKEITVTITEQDVKTLPDGTKEVDIDTIAQKLGDAGLIEYPSLFKFFAEITGKDEHLSPGTYTLNAYFDYNAMINGMSSYEKPREIVTVVIPEGYNCAQLFALLETYEVCTVEQLEEAAANGKDDFSEYWFITDEIPWGEKYCLEGYLFPDTYEFYTNDDPTHVLDKMLSNFDARFTNKMKENLATIQDRYGLSLHQVLTIASMVEEEAVGATKTTTDYEGYDIASVYYNRLANWSTPILGCDATVYYAMGDYFGTVEKLTATHLDTDSPYNTRKYAGLPPGPITNPGSYSMYAALDPNDTEYYYYVYDPEQRRHILSKTEAEHDRISAELGY